MKKFLITILFLAQLVISRAQSSEVGITAGVSTYKGDLKTTMFTWNNEHFAYGVLFRHSMSNHWSFKAGLNFGKISAADSISDSPYQKYRNLSFRSKFQELNLQFEFNFFTFQTANPVSKWSPYLSIGLTTFHFNPQAELNGDWLDLQPLGTEGQGTTEFPDRKKYKRVQVALSFGGGAKWRLSRRFGLVVDCGVRKTYTDYLDDVSTTYPDLAILAAQNGTDAAALSDRTPNAASNDNTNRDRGNLNNKDWYVFTGVQLTYTISKKYNDPCKPFRTKFR